MSIFGNDVVVLERLGGIFFSTSAPGSEDTFTPGSNCMSTTKCVNNCTFTPVYIVALPGVDVSNLEKKYIYVQLRVLF